jgi:hypothetical protein
MADERATGLRRTHSVAIPLAEFSYAERGAWESIPLATRTRTFRLGLPDARLTVALAVMFVPAPAYLGYEPLNLWWEGWWAANRHYLSIQARERANEQSNALMPVDNVFGSPTNPVGNAEDLYGWLVSGEPDAREWLCRLVIADPPAPVGASKEGVWGRFVAAATFTSHVDMTEAEWKRVANRIYLLGEFARITFGRGSG